MQKMTAKYLQENTSQTTQPEVHNTEITGSRYTG